MDGSIWKDLLDGLGCLDNGRFVAPKDIREVFITLRSVGGNRVITLSCGKQAPDGWSYTNDFIVHNDGKGHTLFHAWYDVGSVNVNEA
ncbi:MAG TPA: hypothetical protein VGM37_10900 [Armatimonadota bacterium]